MMSSCNRWQIQYYQFQINTNWSSNLGIYLMDVKNNELNAERKRARASDIWRGKKNVTKSMQKLQQFHFESCFFFYFFTVASASSMESKQVWRR